MSLKEYVITYLSKEYYAEHYPEAADIWSWEDYSIGGIGKDITTLVTESVEFISEEQWEKWSGSNIKVGTLCMMVKLAVRSNEYAKKRREIVASITDPYLRESVEKNG